MLSESAVEQLPCYASVLWPNDPGQVAESARRFLAQGYRAVKYGWAPMGPDPALDAALVKAARDALGPEVELMVDAGRVWDVETALSRAELFAPYDIAWLEEPLKPFDFAGYAQLTAQSPVPIAAGEALALLEDYVRLIEPGGIHIAQPDLGRIGGITQGQRLAAYAQAKSVRPVPHAFGTGVLLAASAQWASALAAPLTEYTRAPSPLAQNLAHQGIQFKEGLLHLSDAPGLGVELDMKEVERLTRIEPMTKPNFMIVCKYDNGTTLYTRPDPENPHFMVRPDWSRTLMPMSFVAPLKTEYWDDDATTDFNAMMARVEQEGAVLQKSDEG